MLPAPLTQLTAGEQLRLLVKLRPEIQHRNEIGTRIRKFRMRLVGLRLRIGGSLSWVLNLQERGNDKHLSKARMTRRCNQHSCKTRIDWERCDLSPKRGHVAIGV